MREIFLIIRVLSLSILSFIPELINAQEPLNPAVQTLTHWMSPEEFLRRHEIGKSFNPTPPPPAPVVNIAEFNHNEGVLIRYPFGIPMNLIKEMSNTGKVTTVVASQSQQNTVYNQYVSNGVNVANCDFLIAPTNSYWTRDYGPWFVIDGNDEVGIVDFPYNRPRPADDDIPVKMAEFMNVPLYGMNVVHTGGNYMCDGMGNGASTDLVYSENTISQTMIHEMVNNYLGVVNYHVRPDPNGTYIDHIDCWAKFLDVDKILIRAVPNTHPQYSQIESAAAYWQNAISGYGVPYQVIRVNTPNDQPYSNSFILKNRVFLPITGNSTHDNAAIQVYQNAMPGYEILGIYQNPSTPWESTDALHCRTHEVADKGMLFIRHLPVLTSQPSDEDYLINVYINPLSGRGLIPDSTRLFYKNGAGSYQEILLQSIGGNDFTALIPRQPEGSTVFYYIQASDSSGRNMFHPYIGKPDPHSFPVGAGVHPHIAVSTNSIDTTAHPAQVIEAGLTISNTGYADLVFVISTDTQSAGWLSAGVSQGIVTPGAQTGVDIFLDASLLPVGLYEGVLYIQSNDPDKPLDSVMVHFNVTSGVGVHQKDFVAGLKAGPNPFSDDIIFQFRLEKPTTVSVCVFNLQGQIVKTLASGGYTAGLQEVAWNGTDQEGNFVQKGLYVVRLIAGNEVFQYKILYAK